MLRKIGLYLIVAVLAGVLGISLGGVYTKSRQSAAAAGSSVIVLEEAI